MRRAFDQEPADLLAVIALVAVRRRCIQRLNLLLKARIVTQTKDIAQAQLVTQVQNLWRAVMAVGAQQGPAQPTVPSEDDDGLEVVFVIIKRPTSSQR